LKPKSTAANRLIALGGGFVAVRDRAVVAELALPVAGLVSLRSFEDVAHDLERLRGLPHAAVAVDGDRGHPRRARVSQQAAHQIDDLLRLG
jgi:adenine deaminase